MCVVSKRIGGRVWCVKVGVGWGNKPCQSAYYESSLQSKQTYLFLTPSNPQTNHPNLANQLAHTHTHTNTSPPSLSMTINVLTDSLTQSNIYFTAHAHARVCETHSRTHLGQRRVPGFIVNTTHLKIYSP